MAQEKQYEVLASKFLAWYFSDTETCEIFCRNRMMESFNEGGSLYYEVDFLWKETSEIPTNLIENWDNPSVTEIDRQTINVVFINDKK